MSHRKCFARSDESGAGIERQDHRRCRFRAIRRSPGRSQTQGAQGLRARRTNPTRRGRTENSANPPIAPDRAALSAREAPRLGTSRALRVRPARSGDALRSAAGRLGVTPGPPRRACTSRSTRSMASANASQRASRKRHARLPARHSWSDAKGSSSGASARPRRFRLSRNAKFETSELAPSFASLQNRSTNIAGPTNALCRGRRSVEALRGLRPRREPAYG